MIHVSIVQDLIPTVDCFKVVSLEVIFADVLLIQKIDFISC